MADHPADSPAYRWMEEGLRRVAPDEVEHLPTAWADRMATPEAPVRRHRDTVLGHGDLPVTLTLLGSAVVAVGTNVLANLLTEGVVRTGNGLWSRLRARLRRRRIRRSLTSPEPLPPLDAAQLEDLSDLLYHGILDAGRSEDEAAAVAAALADAYPARADGPSPTEPDRPATSDDRR